MKSSQVASCRKRLLRRGRELVRTGAGRTVDGDVMGALDEAERGELALVHQALERVERGIYGRCVTCSTWIEPDRLEELPWEPSCATCRQDVEQPAERAAPPL